MAGLYLHIPFCKQACHYCNFHFSTNLSRKDEMVQALIHEIEHRADYLPLRELSSIYFGGGTPSLLDDQDLELLFKTIESHFDIHPLAEITMEANPDDLNSEKIKILRNTPINRLSIGIQSFSQADLTYMNRAHNAIEARACIEYAQDAGFENLTIDLIYGSPTTSDRVWEQNVQIALDYELPHISAYCLTVEPKTALAKFVETGKSEAPDDSAGARHFQTLMRMLQSSGYDHYEISNFAMPGWYAKHNSSYWKGEPYLGIGPSAHSFDGLSRQWNVNNNAHYMKAMGSIHEHGQSDNIQLFEKEILTEKQRYNEYVLTSMRTSWGCRLEKINERFRTHFLEQIHPFVKQGKVEHGGDQFRLTPAGKLIADHIAMELFLVE